MSDRAGRSRSAATCLAIFITLRERRQPSLVAELADLVVASKATVERHLAVLELYGLVCSEADEAHQQRRRWRAA